MAHGSWYSVNGCLLVNYFKKNFMKKEKKKKKNKGQVNENS